MAPKKAGSAAPKKAASAPAHGSYQDMIRNAIIQLKDRSGSSRQALKKYVLANNSLGDVSDAAFTSRFNKALSAGSDSGVFLRPKGASGPVKLAKSGAAVKKTEDKKPVAEKKAAPAKKAPAAKKAAPATKATKTATKANTSKVRKSPAKADAVQAPKTVTSKTGSGRVTKTAAPKTAKKPAAKKAKAAPKAKAAAKVAA